MNVVLNALSAASELAAVVPIQIPDSEPVQPPGLERITTLIGWAKWVALAICLLGLLAAGALMAINARRGEGGENVGRIGFALGGVIVISAAASLIGFLA